MKRQLVLVVLTLTACRHATSLPYYSDRTLTPRFIADDSPVLDTLHRIGDFSFVDQRGRSVTRRTVSDKIVVASFFYASCRQLCPTLRSQLRRVQSAFRDDDGLVILSHTIAPESDSVEVLERYARQNHLDDERWLLLTGARSELERMARDDYFVELTDSGGKTNGKLLHTETFVLNGDTADKLLIQVGQGGGKGKGKGGGQARGQGGGGGNNKMVVRGPHGGKAVVSKGQKNTVVRRNTYVNKTYVNKRVVVVRPVRGWYRKPYYGNFVAGVALGTVLAVGAVGVAPIAPASNLCWYWSDPAMINGYWDYCY